MVNKLTFGSILREKMKGICAMKGHTVKSMSEMVNTTPSCMSNKLGKGTVGAYDLLEMLDAMGYGLYAYDRETGNKIVLG